MEDMSHIANHRSLNQGSMDAFMLLFSVLIHWSYLVHEPCPWVEFLEHVRLSSILENRTGFPSSLAICRQAVSVSSLPSHFEVISFKNSTIIREKPTSKLILVTSMCTMSHRLCERQFKFLGDMNSIPWGLSVCLPSTLCPILQPNLSSLGTNEIKPNPPVSGVFVNKYVSYSNTPMSFFNSALALIQFVSRTFKDIVDFYSFDFNIVPILCLVQF